MKIIVVADPVVVEVKTVPLLRDGIVRRVLAFDES